jgi:leucyl-tRNA synthetase
MKVEIGVQVDGESRGMMMVDPDEPAVGWQAQQIEAVAKAIAGRKIKRVVYVPDRIVNLVTESL